MACFRSKVLVLLFLSLSLVPLSISKRVSFPLALQDSSLGLADVHDLFPKYHLPKGLLPENVKSYSMSSIASTFKIELTYQCYVQFKDHLVLYDPVITGKLGYGKVSDVSGIHAKKLFFWIPVTGMDLDESTNMIIFHAGILSQQLPAVDFQIIPSCLNQGIQESSLASV